MSRVALLVACSTTMMGCLITREPVYEAAPNLPPSVLGTTESPMTTICEVDLDSPLGADAGIDGVGSCLEFQALVRDANVDQSLEGVWFVNRNPNAPNPADIGFLRQFDIPPEGGADPTSRRITPFTVPAPALRLGCNRLELHVSERFVNAPNATPVTASDLGVGVWWIAAFNEGAPVVDMTACDRE